MLCLSINKQAIQDEGQVIEDDRLAAEAQEAVKVYLYIYTSTQTLFVAFQNFG
jgi:hypothetical protein